jgi:uncharacterized protein (TIGR02600 family)
MASLTLFMRRKSRHFGRKTGISLIVTVGALALVMFLVLALLEGVSHQAQQGPGGAATAEEKMLADSAVAMVIDQIQQASTQPGKTWISQPGLLRTYDTTSSRKHVASYKLYSATQMIDTSGTLAFLATDIPSDWNSATNANAYTDLNSAMQTSSFFGQKIYPILDPTAATAVEGISIDTGHDVSMPVAWIYQLKDGTFGPASNGTKTNPIVARIAFWTDDETSKININTAGCGTGWNSPHVNSTDDVAWSTTQPAQGEYSSYPGHPATTSLVPVFGQGSGALTSQQLLGLSPRYAWGGSQFGTQSTTSGEMVAPKTDRLYGSVDELCFGSSQTSSNQRATNPVTASQINIARFVLTAHSHSPEVTMLGEPRFAIWPVSDSPKDSTRTTATDRAIESAATVGTRNYFFQRHNALSPTDDLNASVVPSNAQFFSDLVSRGSTTLPGYGAAFASGSSPKYSGVEWTQLVLEMTDFIRGLNAIDPSPAPFVSYAAGDSSGAGTGFIVPLNTTYGSGASQVTLRGLNRCPTLSSLTLIFYVCGFGFDDGTSIDYTSTPDDAAGTSWNKNFAVNSTTNRWKHVTSELVRAFVVPCTFQPGCAYPEVSEACDIQISGLNKIGISSGTASGDFGFAAACNSRLLNDALTVLPAERAWGGNEGPLAWRAAAIDAMNSGASYPFAGTKAFAVPLASGATLDSLTGGPSIPDSWAQTLTFNGVTGLTVNIRDRNGNTLQTLSVDLPGFSIHAPTINGEFDHADGTTPSTSNPAWTTTASCQVAPSYYMNLRNRLLATQLSRACMIQAGDITRSVEATTDLRVIAGLNSVPSSLFHTHPSYSLNSTNAQGGSQAHNFRFADGTSACFASGATQLIGTPYPSATGTMTAADWRDGSPVAYTWSISPPVSSPTSSKASTKSITMSPVQNINGDWDTGPGLETDGAQIALPDAGTTLSPSAAYFSLSGGQIGAATQRTPNALVPSPVAFGSLPAGINPSQPASSEPWRTLLFCPYPAGDTAHPGFASPPDYLILDNFWMPTIEPYAISGCMTTAGKINLNDQIAPFTWIHRTTALHALLTDLRIPAIPASMVSSYKTAGTPITSIWKTVDENATISQIENRFANSSADAYLSESEICTVPLVPQGLASTSVAATQTALDAFWNGAQGQGRLTGDNLRELPYAQLYGRLTTRSNSYTVHVRVQVLQKLPGDPQQNVWKEGVDLIRGDWRGSYEIERYLDPTATAPTAGQPLGPYKFRIVSVRQFAP